MEDYTIPYLWTSGRLCASGKCQIEDRVTTWKWLGSQKAIPAGPEIPNSWSRRPWSPTGHFKRIQPDNAEYPLNGNTEDCLALLYNVYKDGIKWHDVACYHPKSIVCEDEYNTIENYYG